MDKLVDIYIFSFNRGRYLNNCIESIYDCMDNHNINIYDDSSTDKYTIMILNKWEDKCRIMRTEESNTIYKVGGLYNNMNYAINDAYKRNVKYVLFIQDDMQVVRKYTQEDENIMNKYFEENIKAVQYYPCFFKMHVKDAVKNRKLDTTRCVYFKNISLQYSGFSAVGIFHVERFKKYFGKFQGRERIMDNIARDMGIRKGEAVYPFMMYLPHPKSYRGKNRSFAHKISEFISGAGYYPINYMDEKELKVFFERDPLLIPYAEEYLTVKGLNKKPWSFAGGITALYEQAGYKRILAKILKRMG